MEMFGVSTQTVKLWRDTGSIGYAKIGLRYIYTREDIARFIEEFHYKPDDYGNS
jgi:DNA-binding transcriptional MerR regulator